MERTLSKARLTGGERERAVAHASRTSVLVSGANEHGALCLPHTDAVEVPTRLLALRSQFVRCVGAGDGWSVCGTSAGLLAAWGAGELPLPIGHISSGCTTLACDGSRVHFLTDEGEVFSWIFSTEHLAPPPQRVALPFPNALPLPLPLHPRSYKRRRRRSPPKQFQMRREALS